MDGIELRERPSPNKGPRRGVGAPDLVILHYTNMPSAEEALDRLCDPEAKVSAHYLIEPSGVVWRMVPEEERAWHAGVSKWGEGAPGCVDADINSRSIGIELSHPGHNDAGECAPFVDQQIIALERLLREILRRWAIAPHRVLAHSDVAPGRKTDPGEMFDWRRLADAGLARAHPEIPGGAPSEIGSGDADTFVSALRAVGYGDWPFEDLLDAFRRRWRPEAMGAPFATADLTLANALARG